MLAAAASPGNPNTRCCPGGVPRENPAAGKNVGKIWHSSTGARWVRCHRRPEHACMYVTIASPESRDLILTQCLQGSLITPAGQRRNWACRRCQTWANWPTKKMPGCTNASPSHSPVLWFLLACIVGSNLACRARLCLRGWQPRCEIECHAHLPALVIARTWRGGASTLMHRHRCACGLARGPRMLNATCPHIRRPGSPAPPSEAALQACRRWRRMRPLRRTEACRCRAGRAGGAPAAGQAHHRWLTHLAAQQARQIDVMRMVMR